MGDLQNQFSWSKSRDDKFRTCLRQYYFHYYGSWGGWNFNADERCRKIYILKQLKNRKMWAGEKVHDCIRKSLHNIRNNIEPMSEDQAIDTTIDVMRKEYLSSKRGDYWKNPKSSSLIEHEYDFNIPDSEWKANAEHVALCLRTFYGSDVYKLIRGLSGSQWLEVEEFSGFLLQGDKVHVVLDFSCRKGDEIWIYDWKTGRTESERNSFQLACYTLYAVQKWNVEPKKIKTVEFNLLSAKASQYDLERTDLEAIKNHMLSSIRDMKQLLDDVDGNMAREERFAFTEDENTCRYCNFRKVCPKWT